MSCSPRYGLVPGMIAALLLWGAADPALAAAPFEPNDTIDQPAGPLAGGQIYSATTETRNDDDWYRLYLAGNQQIAMNVTMAPVCADGLADTSSEWRLLTDLGETVTHGDRDASFLYTTPPSGGEYFFEVVARAHADINYVPCNYTVQFTPPEALVDGPPPLPRMGLPEPNNSRMQATPNLTAGVIYTGTIETSNDRDWGSFSLLPNTDVTVEFTTICPQTADGDPGEAVGEVHPPLSDTANKLLNPAAFHNHRARNSFNTEDQGGVYFLEVSGEQGCSWQVVLSPISAFGTLRPSVGKPGATSGSGRVSYSTQVSLRRQGRRISGRVTSAGKGCGRQRRVVLRRLGQGLRSAGRSVTRADGRYVIRLARVPRGRIYVVATDRVVTGNHCRVGRSRAL